MPPDLWEKCIIEEVSQDSTWYAVFLSNAFAKMEFHILGNSSWETLSKRQQDMIVHESLKSVLIPAGSFMMGVFDNDTKANSNEHPNHNSVLTQGVHICSYAVTQGLYEHVMKRNTSRFTGATKPVEQISWCDAILFL